jgi:hypothetical protein
MRRDVILDTLQPSLRNSICTTNKSQSPLLRIQAHEQIHTSELVFKYHWDPRAKQE